MDCLPPDTIEGSCKEMPESVAKQLTANGGGRDAAHLNDPEAAMLRPAMPTQLPPSASGEQQIEAAQAADEEAFQEAAIKAQLATTEVTAKDQIEQRIRETGVMVAKAAGMRAEGAALDARAGQVEADSAAAALRSSAALRSARLDGRLAVDAKAKLAAAVVRAGIYARSAAESQKMAADELLEIQAIPDQVSAAAAAAAEAQLEGDARQWDAKLAASEKSLLIPTVPPALTEVGEAAAAPYYSEMQKAMGERFALEEQSRSLTQAATTFDQNAVMLRKQAAAYEKAGREDLSKQMKERARGLWKQADQADAASEADYIKAQEIAETIPTWETYAHIAEQRASAMSKQYWMPPPVPNTLGLVGASSAAPAPAPGLAIAPAPAAAAAFLARDARGVARRRADPALMRAA